MKEEVNHPDHYNQYPIECIDVIRHLPISWGNVIKYVWRYKEKEKPLVDLEKALWYLSDVIKMGIRHKASDKEIEMLIEALKFLPEGVLPRAACELILIALDLRANQVSKREYCLYKLHDIINKEVTALRKGVL